MGRSRGGNQTIPIMQGTKCERSRLGRVKSGNFGQRLSSEIHLQTVEIQMRHLIRISTFFLVNIVFIPIDI